MQLIPLHKSNSVSPVNFNEEEKKEENALVLLTPRKNLLLKDKSLTAKISWQKIYANLPWLTYALSKSESLINSKMMRLIFNTIFIWKSYVTKYNLHGTNIKKLEKLVKFLCQSELLSLELKKVVKEKNIFQRIFQYDIEMGEDFECLSDGIQILPIGTSAGASLELLGIFQALESLLELQEGIEELIDNRKLVKDIEKLSKKIPTDKNSVEMLHNLEKIKGELLSNKFKRQTFGLFARSAFSFTSGTTETFSGILYFAGAASVATPMSIVSASTGIVTGTLQTGCSVRNIFKGVETYIQIKKFKKASEEIHTEETLLLTDFIAEERYKIIKKISANVANGIGGTGAILIGIAGIALLVTTPFSLGVTLPLGIAAIVVSLAGIAAKYGTIYLLDKKHDKKLKLNPAISRPALCLRLLQLLDKPDYTFEQSKAIEIFLQYYKKQLNNEELPVVEQLKGKIMIELASTAKKNLMLFKIAWRAIIEEEHDILLENEKENEEICPEYEVLSQ